MKAYPSRISVAAIQSVNAVTRKLRIGRDSSCHVNDVDWSASSDVFVKEVELVMVGVAKELSPDGTLVSINGSDEQKFKFISIIILKRHRNMHFKISIKGKVRSCLLRLN